MIYSRWRWDTGGYDYFESSQRMALGDDLPKPRLGFGTALGVASVDAGRSLPFGSRHIGSGQQARGSVAPVSRSGPLGALAMSIGFGEIAMVAAGALLGWWLRGRTT